MELSDEEYLDMLLTEQADREVFTEIEGYHRHIEDRMKVIIAAGHWSSDKSDELREFLKQNTTSAISKGKFISQLTEMALEIIGADRPHASKIPVGMLPSKEFNACAILTPRKGATI